MPDYFLDVVRVDEGAEKTIRVPYPSGAGFTDAVENVQTVYSAPFELSDADILAWPTTDIVVKTAEEGKLFIPFFANFFARLTTAYGNIHATNGQILVIDSGNGDGTLLQGPRQDGTLDDFGALFGSYGEGFLDVMATAIPAAKTDAGGIAWTTAVSGVIVANELSLKCVNGDAGNFTGGNAANTIKGNVLYYEITV
jgi:hypothetical protein